MAGDDGTDGSSRLYTVRIWSEEVDGGTEHRGSVRSVESGAYRNFRDWSDLTSFLVSRLEDHPREEQS